MLECFLGWCKRHKCKEALRYMIERNVSLQMASELGKLFFKVASAEVVENLYPRELNSK